MAQAKRRVLLTLQGLLVDCPNGRECFGNGVWMDEEEKAIPSTLDGAHSRFLLRRHRAPSAHIEGASMKRSQKHASGKVLRLSQT